MIGVKTGSIKSIPRPPFALFGPPARAAMPPQRLPHTSLLTALLLISVYLYWRASFVTKPSEVDLGSLEIVNATLGFGAVYAISAHNSPRKDGLLQAVNVTGLDIDIPLIPDWTEEEVEDFRGIDHEDKTTIKNGSIKAWLSHAVALKEFLDSGKETALFIEDDVDWDIRLRTVQVPLAARAQRTLLPKTDYGRYYWGNPKDWDLFYLGHCGDYFASLDGMNVGVGITHPSDLEAIPHVLFQDPTMLDPTDIHPFTQSLLTSFHIPPKTRMIHKSKWPLCTFGYAVTRDFADLLLNKIAPPLEQPGMTAHAYDIALLEACRDKGYRCFTTNPELFHHMEGLSLIDGKADKITARPPADRVGTTQVRYRNETSNINCGFWSKDFRFDDDMNKLARLKVEVGRQGKCLKPGRNEDGSRKKYPLLVSS